MKLGKIFCQLLSVVGMLMGAAQIVRAMMTDGSVIQSVFFGLIVVGSIYLFELTRKED